MVAAVGAEIVAFARTAAKAEFDLARIRAMKTVTMSASMAAASLPVAAVAHDTEMELVAISASERPLFERAPGLVTTSLPSSGQTGHADALRRSLIKLQRLDRYEQLAAARRNRAVLHIIAKHIFMTVIIRSR